MEVVTVFFFFLLQQKMLFIVCCLCSESVTFNCLTISFSHVNLVSSSEFLIWIYQSRLCDEWWVLFLFVSFFPLLVFLSFRLFLMFQFRWYKTFYANSFSYSSLNNWDKNKYIRNNNYNICEIAIQCDFVIVWLFCFVTKINNIPKYREQLNNFQFYVQG